MKQVKRLRRLKRQIRSQNYKFIRRFKLEAFFGPEWRKYKNDGTNKRQTT